MRPARLYVVTLAGAILLGALLLHAAHWALPAGSGLKFIDALFTATSAACVTGLTVRDTGTEFSGAGQAVILLLIQLGGLGTLTFTNLFFLLRWQRLGLPARMQLETSFGAIGSITPRQLLAKIVKYTIAAELAGALVLSLRFAVDFPWPHAIWLGLFHSVSAFCNAGFGLFASSLMDYRDDFIVNVVIMGEIVAGGLGFVVFADLSQWVHRRLAGLRPHLLLHSRVVLITTAALIGLGTVLFTLLEFHGVNLGGDRWAALHSGLFLSVTARTAGFNTLDTSMLTNPTLLMLILFMAVGGSPGSTAGGVKTTTAATMFAMALSRIRNRPHVELLGRRLPEETVSKALATVLGYVTCILAAVVLLQFTEGSWLPHNESRGMLLDYAFEVVSAIGTVGLSTGVTAALSVGGKVIIMLLMFLGRLGPLLVATSLVGRRPVARYTLPEENINIG